MWSNNKNPTLTFILFCLHRSIFSCRMSNSPKFSFHHSIRSQGSTTQVDLHTCEPFRTTCQQMANSQVWSWVLFYNIFSCAKLLCKKVSADSVFRHIWPVSNVKKKKNSFCLYILSCCHWLTALNIMSNFCIWTAEPIRKKDNVSYAFHSISI